MRYVPASTAAILRFLLASIFALLARPGLAADSMVASNGPLIDRYGPVYDIPKPGFQTPTDITYKAVFDVGPSPEDPSQVNPRIESLARFLNMHARAGVRARDMKLALVLHGPAGKDALSDSAYKSRFGVHNPNRALIEDLAANNVRIILCGQTAAHGKFGSDELAPGVDLALSAMTALVALQSDGYGLIAF
jgi:intracellular sulfur oxidation DsrE/DsrF family protein